MISMIFFSCTVSQSVSPNYFNNFTSISIEGLSTERKRDLLLQSLNSSTPSPSLSSLSPELRGLFPVLEYWSRNQTITSAHIYSILLCRFILVFVIQYFKSQNYKIIFIKRIFIDGS